MSMLDQFQRLDDMIVEHTKSPVQTIFRNQLALTREQIEAYQAASDKQDATLAKQAETIAELQEENKKLVATVARLQALNEPPPIRVIDPLGPPTYEPD